MDRHADDKAGNSREQPAEVQVEQRQIPFRQLDRRVEPQGRPHTGGQRLEKVEDRRSPREDHGRKIHGAVVPEELAREGQNDQCGGGRIDEHEHGDGILDDRTQAHVGDGEGEQREQNRPELIGNFPVRHLDERFRAGGHEADGGFETGEGNGDGENDLADAAEVMPRDLRQGDAAVVGDLKQPARLPGNSSALL